MSMAVQKVAMLCLSGIFHRIFSETDFPELPWQGLGKVDHIMASMTRIPMDFEFAHTNLDRFHHHRTATIAFAFVQTNQIV